MSYIFSGLKRVQTYSNVLQEDKVEVKNSDIKPEIDYEKAIKVFAYTDDVILITPTCASLLFIISICE